MSEDAVLSTEPPGAAEGDQQQEHELYEQQAPEAAVAAAAEADVSAQEEAPPETAGDAPAETQEEAPDEPVTGQPDDSSVVPAEAAAAGSQDQVDLVPLGSAEQQQDGEQPQDGAQEQSAAAEEEAQPGDAPASDTAPPTPPAGPSPQDVDADAGISAEPAPTDVRVEDPAPPRETAPLPPSAKPTLDVPSSSLPADDPTCSSAASSPLAPGGSLLTQSAPVSPGGARSPFTPMRSRQAPVTLRDVLASKDVMLLARNVVQQREQQGLYTSLSSQKFAKVDTKRSTLPTAVVSKTTPVSLVVHPPRGQHLVPPEGWRSSWSAEDFHQVLAADRQLQEAEARKLKEERKAFNLELAARWQVQQQQQQQGRQSPSPTSRGGSARPTESGRPATSPLREHEQRVMANAQQRWQQRQEQVERKLKHKEEEGKRRVQQLQQARASESAEKSQGTERAVLEAQQRAELMNTYRSSVLSRDAQDKEQRRHSCALRKEASVSQGIQSRSAHSMLAINLVQSKHQELLNSHELYQLTKLKKLEEATQAAAARAARQLSQQATRIASSREQRFQVAAQKLSEQQRLNEAAGKHVMAEWERRQALLGQRERHEAAREQQLHQQHMVALVSRHFAKELELQAMVQNRLPEPSPHMLRTLAALKLQT